MIYFFFDSTGKTKTRNTKKTKCIISLKLKYVFLYYTKKKKRSQYSYLAISDKNDINAIFMTTFHLKTEDFLQNKF